MAKRLLTRSMDVSSTIAEAKKALRARVRQAIAALTPQECLESDRALFDRFLSLPQVQAADTLFLFWGIPGREPETERLVRELTRQGKRVGLPRMLPGHQMEVRQFDPRIPMKQAGLRHLGAIGRSSAAGEKRHCAGPCSRRKL